MNEHLDLDTDFLSKTTETKKAGAASAPASVKPNKWKPWLIGGGIVFGVIVLVAASDESSSTYSSPSTNPTPSYSAPGTSDDVMVGKYRCSSYNSSRAHDLRPDVSEATIESESNAIEARIDALNSRGDRIDGMYVDEYDQYSVDSYNSEVNSYNSAKNRLGNDVTVHEMRLERYNNQVDVYNNFLESNCTPAY